LPEIQKKYLIKIKDLKHSHPRNITTKTQIGRRKNAEETTPPPTKIGIFSKKKL